VSEVERHVSAVAFKHNEGVELVRSLNAIPQLFNFSIWKHDMADKAIPGAKFE